MKLRTKKGWKTLVPHHLKGKSALRFSLFPKVNSNSYGPGETPVYLNVYDLTPMNGYMYWTGLGIYHSGVEVYGVEYAFGAHDYPTSGVFEVEPRQCPGFKFRKSIFIGTTCLDPVQVREFMERQSTNYNGDTYHLIVKNCNHFCKDICYKLTGKSIPTWVNRLARLGISFVPLTSHSMLNQMEVDFQDTKGSACNCILPEALRISAVRHDPNFQTRESEKRRLRSAVNCVSSISMRQKHLSTSSLFLQSPMRGCLSSWEFRKSIKER